MMLARERLCSKSQHLRVIEEPLGTLAQLIDILPMIVLHALVWPPVALLMNDMGDLLEGVAHACAPSHLIIHSLSFSAGVFVVWLAEWL
jgi:hypothetical protein